MRNPVRRNPLYPKNSELLPVDTAYFRPGARNVYLTRGVRGQGQRQPFWSAPATFFLERFQSRKVAALCKVCATTGASKPPLNS